MSEYIIEFSTKTVTYLTGWENGRAVLSTDKANAKRYSSRGRALNVAKDFPEAAVLAVAS